MSPLRSESRTELPHSRLFRKLTLVPDRTVRRRFRGMSAKYAPSLEDTLPQAPSSNTTLEIQPVRKVGEDEGL